MEDRPLSDLRRQFLDTSTLSMPLAGAICWAAVGTLALVLPERTTATLALYIMAVILPLAVILDRLRGRNLFAGSTDNPLLKLFLQSIAGIAVTVPLVVMAARSDPLLMVVGMAILAGVIWIPYGWAAGDPVGLRHAVARAIGVYLAFAFAPRPYAATAVCAVVVLAYAYSLMAMKKPGSGLASPAG